MPDPSGYDDVKYSDYIQPINDHEDEQLDLLLSDLHSVVQAECREDLVDDNIPIQLATIADDVLQAAEHETEEMLNVDEDPLLYDGSRRHLGVVMLLLSCFMIRFRLSDETMQYFVSVFTKRQKSVCRVKIMFRENRTRSWSLFGWRITLSIGTLFT